ncbi:MAG: hypothetical protein ACR2MG_02920 [Pyrinomonadaceae bacterium]
MKNKFYVLVSVFVLASAVSAQGKPDLSIGPFQTGAGLYFTGTQTKTFDISNKKKFVAQGGTLQLSKSEATICEGDTCVFNIGFVVQRYGGNENLELSTYGLFQVGKGGLVGNTITFPKVSNLRTGILPLKLMVGTNKVTFTIDPYQKTPESNENNNSLSVTINVTPTLIVIPGKKNKPRDGKP